MKLKINGRLLDLRPAPPTATRILKYLNALPRDEVKTTSDLLRETRIPRSSLCNISTEAERHFARHRELIGGRYYWGHQEAIVQLRRMAKAQP